MNISETMTRISEEYLSIISPESQTNYKPIIEKFSEYILDAGEYDDNNCTGEDYFNKHITRQTIIQAGAHYVNTAEKVRSDSAIEKFLLFFRDFQKRIIEKHYSHSPVSAYALKTPDDLFDEIKRAAEKELAPSGSNIHVDANGYRFLCEYIDKNKPREDSPRRYKNFLINTAFKLFLLYGFKRETILNMKKKMAVDVESEFEATFFDKDERVLVINTDFCPVKLELPYSLSQDLSKLESESPSPIWLFSSESSRQLTTSYFELIRVKRHAYSYDEIHKVGLDVSSFTLEGMAKYGIINMLIRGMNPMIVKMITGARDNVLDYCQREAMELLAGGSENRKAYNGHINSTIRSIITYDDFR